MIIPRAYGGKPYQGPRSLEEIKERREIFFAFNISCYTNVRSDSETDCERVNPASPKSLEGTRVEEEFSPEKFRLGGTKRKIFKEWRVTSEKLGKPFNRLTLQLGPREKRINICWTFETEQSSGLTRSKLDPRRN